MSDAMVTYRDDIHVGKPCYDALEDGEATFRRTSRTDSPRYILNHILRS